MSKYLNARMDQPRDRGIGNIHADEILFQARLHPGSPANAPGPGYCPRCGAPLVIDERGGRTSYHCPRCQAESPHLTCAVCMAHLIRINASSTPLCH
jgi:hypothetical protein